MRCCPEQKLVILLAGFVTMWVLFDGSRQKVCLFFFFRFSQVFFFHYHNHYKYIFFTIFF